MCDVTPCAPTQQSRAGHYSSSNASISSTRDTKQKYQGVLSQHLVSSKAYYRGYHHATLPPQYRQATVQVTIQQDG
jgi:hypothetical protein